MGKGNRDRHGEGEKERMREGKKGIKQLDRVTQNFFSSRTCQFKK